MSKKDVYNSETGILNTVDLTSEEETKKTTEIAKFATEATALENAKTKSATDAKAGNDKLIALGLTQDQVTAMTGYSIPVEE